jgi:hypothetical protein
MEHTATEERTTMEERLEGLLNRVSDWLKYEEAKNVALVTLNTVGVGAALQITPKHSLSVVILGVCLLLFLVSVLIGLASFYPMLDPDRLHDAAIKSRPERAKDRKKTRPEWRPNVIFFRDIAGTNEDDYLEDLRLAAHEDPVNSTRLERDYASEIITNAELTLWKINRFRDAFFITAVGVVALAIAVLVDRFPVS